MSKESSNLEGISEDLKAFQEGLEKYGKETIRRVVQAHLQEIDTRSFVSLRRGLEALMDGGGRFLMAQMINGSISKQIKQLKTEKNEGVFQLTQELMGSYGQKVQKARRLNEVGPELVDCCHAAKLIKNGHGLIEVNFRREDGNSFRLLLFPRNIPVITQKLEKYAEREFPEEIKKTRKEINDKSPEASRNSLGFAVRDE